MTIDIHISLKGFDKLERALSNAPNELFTAMKKSYERIGRSDISKFRREQLNGSGLKIKEKKVLNSFKTKTTGNSIDTLRMEEYAGWKAAQIFETGGTIHPKGQALFVPFPDVLLNGKRPTMKLIEAGIESGQLTIIKNSRGLFVGQKNGKITTFLGHFSRSVQEPKKISFFNNFNSNEAKHDKIIEQELNKSIDRIAIQ